MRAGEPPFQIAHVDLNCVHDAAGGATVISRLHVAYFAFAGVVEVDGIPVVPADTGNLIAISIPRADGQRVGQDFRRLAIGAVSQGILPATFVQNGAMPVASGAPPLPLRSAGSCKSRIALGLTWLLPALVDGPGAVGGSIPRAKPKPSHSCVTPTQAPPSSASTRK